MILLPLLCFVVIYWVAVIRGANRCDAAMAASIILGIYLAFVTEALSTVHHLDRRSVSLAWLVGALIAIAIWLRSGAVAGPAVSPAAIFAGLEVRLCFAATAMLVVLLGVSGIFGAPTNWDSMTYHLPRVMHWMQNQSVADYPTNCLPQLYQPPWAEFAILHLQLLWGSDRFAFLPQWLALIGCAAAAFALAGRLGAGWAGQWLATVFTITLPTGLLQAASTQNNLVVAFWLLCFANGVVTLAKSEVISAGQSLAAGGALGLAMLTKGTAYVIATPLLAWLIFTQMRTGRRGFGRFLIIAVIAIAINAGHWTRNMKRFGSPLTPPTEVAYQVQAMSPSLWLANIVRNLALHTATPFRQFNNEIVAGLAHFQMCIGVDANDPRTTLPGAKFVLRAPHNDEDLTGNPLHLLLLIGIGIGLPRRIAARHSQAGNKSAPRDAIIFFGIAAASFALFCAMLKWQPFHTRLQLPIFILAAAPMGYLLEWLLNARARWVVISVLLVFAFEAVLDSPGHPWFGHNSIFVTPRERQYLTNRRDLYDPYTAAADLAAAHAEGPIGFCADGDQWEYPLWVMLHERLGRWPRIECITGVAISGDVIKGCSAVICVKLNHQPIPPAGWTCVVCGPLVDVLLPVSNTR